MDYTLEFTDERVTITTSGSADVADVTRLLVELVSDPRFTQGLPILADHSALDTRALTAEGARGVGQAFVDFGTQIGRSPLAVVVRDSLTYGLVRVATASAARAPLKVKVVYSRVEAETWLAEQARRRAEASGERAKDEDTPST
jgi:hypothetical protein